MNDHLWHKFVEDNQEKFLKVIKSIVPNEQDAEDILQEVFIKLFEKEDKYETLHILGMTIAKNMAINHYRRMHRYPSFINDPLIWEYNHFTLVDEVEVQDYCDRVRGAIPDTQKGSYLILFSQGFSYKELMDIFNEPMHKIKTGIYEARQIVLEKTNKK